jgi:hypothetical protein
MQRLPEARTPSAPALKQPVAFRVESRTPACHGPAPLASFSRALAQQAAKPLALWPGRPPRTVPSQVKMGSLGTVGGSFAGAAA